MMEENFALDSQEQRCELIHLKALVVAVSYLFIVWCVHITIHCHFGVLSSFLNWLFARKKITFIGTSKHEWSRVLASFACRTLNDLEDFFHRSLPIFEWWERKTAGLLQLGLSQEILICLRKSCEGQESFGTYAILGKLIIGACINKEIFRKIYYPIKTLD